MVIIGDKQFKPYLTEQKIADAVSSLAAEMNEELREEFPLFLAVLNGSFMFASDLMKEVSFPCEISFIKLASYEGSESRGIVNELIGLNEDLSGRTVVIVEDIVDTGNTLEKLIGLLKEKEVKQIKVATLLFKSGVYNKKIPLDYVGIEIENDFVVGYGMDYMGQGRNLKQIYSIV